jgi:hypothetical protein
LVFYFVCVFLYHNLDEAAPEKCVLTTRDAIGEELSAEKHREEVFEERLTKRAKIVLEKVLPNLPPISPVERIKGEEMIEEKQLAQPVVAIKTEYAML